MRVALVALGALSLAGAAMAQSGGPDLGRTNAPRGGTSDTVGAASGWQRLYDANGHMSEKDYRAQLARQMAAAQRLAGQPLTERDRKKIRSAISADFIAWRKQYDPRRADYRAMRERWLVDEASLSPADWAVRRVEWLRAQQQWIVANYGEIEAQASRAR